MIVVSDTSPITNLAAVGRLDLLHQPYGSLKIPQAVSEEVAANGAEQRGFSQVQTSSWIETRAVTNHALVTALMLELHPGESEAIALAIELQANLLLMDERNGRRVATRFGLKYVGLLGVLIEAKSKGLLSAVHPILDDLRSKAGFWISEVLYRRVLQAAGE